MRRIYKTYRIFKSMKRYQIKQMLRNLDTLRGGCAYLPSGPDKVEQIERLLKEMRDECSVKKWGR